MTQITFQPLSQGSPWPDDGPRDRRNSAYKATHDKTMREMQSELSRIGARRCVLEVDLEADQLRRDGLPYANARPASPRVRLSFVHPDVGRISYASDKYTDWTSNIRAIRLTLEALRSVDRYGCVRGSQQYTGFRALDGDVSRPGSMSLQDAVDELGGDHRVTQCQDELKRAYHDRSKVTHPDRGGSDAAFKRTKDAMEIINRECFTRAG